MISLQLGVDTGPEPTPDEQIAEARWLQTLLADERFVKLFVRAADSCVREWSQSKDKEAREHAWMKLQGLRLLETQMQKVLDQGLRVATSGARRSTPVTT